MGRPASAVSVLEELAFLGANTMGALCFQPACGPGGPLDDAVELAALASHAQDVYDDSVERVLPALIRAGGSPGGARPKALIALPDDGSPGVRHGEAEIADGWSAWMVKFPAKHEDGDVGRRELAWMRMAAEAGIEVPANRVLELPGVGSAFAVRRFDRPGAAQRRHMLSAAGALDADFRAALVDYQALLRLCALNCGGDQRQLLALFRLAVFNVAAVNEDDHLKNIAWICDRDGWRLAPGYDLTYAPHPDRRRATSVMGLDQGIRRSHLTALGEGAGIPSRRVHGVIDEVLAATEQVERYNREAGCHNPVSIAAAGAVHEAGRLLR